MSSLSMSGYAYDAAQAQRYAGWIRTFKGNWGFARSSELEGDIFVGLKSNPQLVGVNLLPDDPIEFELKTGPDGKNEAISVNITRGDSGSGQRYAGVVRSFKDVWGFITSSAVDGDLFVGLKSNPHLQTLVPDDEVTFEIKLNDGGKQEAVGVDLVRKPSDMQMITTGPAVRAQASHLIGQRSTGRIKSFKSSWGFVQSDIFTGDMFVHARSNPNLGRVFAGDPIQFEVGDDPQTPGNTQAVNATVAKDDLKNLVGETLHGWVKSFSGTWGFLNSSRFDGDLFVGAKVNKYLEAGPLMTGELVEFQVGRDEKSANGCHAVRIRKVDETGATVQSQALVPVHVSHTSSAQGVVQQLLGRMGGSAASANLLLGQTCYGEVRSYRGEFGFATSSEFMGDIFVGARSNPHLTAQLKQGDQITFTVQQNGSKVEALNVQVGHAGRGGARDRSRTPAPSYSQSRSRDPAAYLGQTVTGWVKSFKGAWGFLNSNEFDGDVFVGKNSNSHLAQDLQAGDKVRFTILQNGPKLEAVSVQVIGHDAVPAASGHRPPAPPPVPGGFRGGDRDKKEAIATLVGALEALTGTSLAGAVGGAKSSRRPPPPAPRTNGGRDPTRMAGTTCVGTVRSYRGSWGFVTSDVFDGDCFVGQRNNPQLPRDLVLGDRVEFVLSVNSKGKAEAEQVRLM